MAVSVENFMTAYGNRGEWLMGSLWVHFWGLTQWSYKLWWKIIILASEDSRLNVLFNYITYFSWDQCPSVNLSAVSLHFLKKNPSVPFHMICSAVSQLSLALVLLCLSKQAIEIGYTFVFCQLFTSANPNGERFWAETLKSTFNFCQPQRRYSAVLLWHQIRDGFMMASDLTYWYFSEVHK